MKLNAKRTVLVGLAFLSISAFWQMYDGIIPLILKNTFHVNDALAGGIMALDNVLAIFLLPLFGTLSDRCNARSGKRMPFIRFGTIGAVIFLILIPIANQMKNLPLFIIGLLLVLLAMSTYRSPAVALMPDVTPKPLRSKGNAVINLMGTVGGMITLLLIGQLVPKGDNPDYLPLFLSVAALMVVAVVVLSFTIRERKAAAEAQALAPDEPEEKGKDGKAAPMPKDVRRSLIFLLCSVAFWFMGYNAVTTAFSKYMQIQWHVEGGDFAYLLLVANVAAAISFLPIGMLATKIGRKKTILGGIVVLGLCFAGAAFFPSFNPLAVVLFAFVGIAWAAINVNSYPMVVEMSRGSNVGKFTGYYYTFSMAAQIITPIVSGALLNISYATLFPYAAACVALSFVTMLFVKHGDSRPTQPKSKLEAFDTPD